MRLWELMNPSDPVTFHTDDFDYAVAVNLLVGEGAYGLRDCYGDSKKLTEMPLFLFDPDTASLGRWLIEAFPEKDLPTDNSDETLTAFLESLDVFRLADILRSVQVCDPKEREAYQKALELMEPDKRQDYAKWWKEKRRSSMNDIARVAWQMADQIEKNEREKQNNSAVQAV